MLYFGTDEGIYRWFPGQPWPIVHGLQGESVTALASGPAGAMVGLTSDGLAWECAPGEGIDWRVLPSLAGTPTAVAVGRGPAGAEILVATTGPARLVRRPLAHVSAEDAGNWLDQLDRVVVRSIGTLTARWRAGKSPKDVASFGVAVAAEPAWTEVGAPDLGTAIGIPMRVRSLTPSEGEAGVYFASVVRAGLWVSRDRGESWTRLVGLPEEVYCLRSLGGGKLVAGTAEGVWQSNDGGATWSDSSKGLENARQVRALDVKPGDPKRLYAGAAPTQVGGASPVTERGGALNFALYESKDAGATWTHVIKDFPAVLEYDAITDVRFDSSDPTACVVGLASGEIWTSRADGAWWEPIARQHGAVRVICPGPVG